MKAKFYPSEIYVDRDLGYTLKIHYGFTDECALHYHDYFEFFLTISGDTVQLINGEEQRLPPHTLVLIRDRDVHGYKKGGDFSFANLAFARETAENLTAYFGESMSSLLKRKMPPTVILNDQDYTHVMERLSSLMSVEVSDRKTKNTRMKLILTEMMSHLLDRENNETQRALPRWLSELMGALRDPKNFGMTLPDMSEKSGKSVEHISRSFKKHIGITASEFANAQKLTYAANLLVSTNLSIIDVCYESGFQNLSYFYRKFKQRFSDAPQAFREKTSYAAPL